MLMDGTDLQFDDGSFDHVTFFYSLMFMSQREQEQAIQEAARVLKHGGELHIWDCDIASAYPEPFCIGKNVVGYGIAVFSVLCRSCAYGGF